MSVAIIFSAMALTVGQADVPAGIVQDLRGQPVLVSGVKFTGPHFSKYTVQEEAGLRVHLPPKREQLGPVGLQSNLKIDGDFEITGAYELLAADKPTKIHGAVGVNIYIILGNDGNRFAKIGRFNTTSHGHAYVVQHTDRKLQKSTTIENFATNVTRGQIRLKRKGTTLSYLVKDTTTKGVFSELYQTEFGADAITTIRFVANTNMEPVGVEARLIELSVRSGNAPDIADDGPPAGPLAERGWLIAAILVGLAIFLALATVLAVGYWMRRRANRAPSGPGGKHVEVIACAQCGKRVKYKAELAGHKVPCPHCGKVQVTPAAAVDS